MKKNYFVYLLSLLCVLIVVGCSREDAPENTILPPIISEMVTQYTILEDEILILSPTVENNENTSYVWTVNGKKVAETLHYNFSSSIPGSYKLMLKATNKAGSDKKEILVTVIEKNTALPIVTNLSDKYIIKIDEDLQLVPKISNDEDVSYEWILNNETVKNTKTYTFKSSKVGLFTLVFRATNKNGTSETIIKVLVKNKTQRLSTETYKLCPIQIPVEADDKQTIKHTITEAASNLYRIAYPEANKALFIAAKEGKYELTITIGDVLTDVIIDVTKRTKTASPYIARVFDYCPAPGQFVNKLPEYSEGDTHEDMVRKAEEWLVGEDAFMITLGGWGGYVTLGFDHTIVNVKGKRDFRINGNAFGANDNKRPGAPFGGSCEPGIIMVAYDKNKNGKPDEDEWYEIKGSANFSAKDEPWYTIAKDNGNDVNVYRDYEMTYYRPTKEEAEIYAEPDNPLAFVIIKDYIHWKDNKNNSGYKVKNVYHKQSYYPGWIKEDEMTFKGIRLAENGVNEGKFNPGINSGGVYFVLYAHRYGYVDNYPNKHDNSAIDIDWAIDKDGNPANLPGIDFVKIYNGVNQENGWLGEASTEVERGEDLHMLEKDIDTIKN